MIQNGINEDFIKKDKTHLNHKHIKLTIMCMIYNDDGSFLVENRIKKDWPGLTFPGGHVEDDEYIVDAVIREMKEETGLDVFDIEPKGYIEWNNFGDNIRHLAMLFRTNNYSGTIKASKEGDIFFINEDDLDKYPLSNDFLEIYKKLK